MLASEHGIQKELVISVNCFKQIRQMKVKLDRRQRLGSTSLTLKNIAYPSTDTGCKLTGVLKWAAAIIVDIIISFRSSRRRISRSKLRVWVRSRRCLLNVLRWWAEDSL
jgi:hypothetical protein